MTSAASGLGTLCHYATMPLCQHCSRPMPVLRGRRGCQSHQKGMHFQNSCLSGYRRSTRHTCRSTSEEESKPNPDDSMARTVSALEALLGIEEEKPKQEQQKDTATSTEASQTSVFVVRETFRTLFQVPDSVMAGMFCMQEGAAGLQLSPGVSEAVVKEVLAAEARRKASGNTASSSNMEKQISEQMVWQYLHVAHASGIWHRHSPELAAASAGESPRDCQKVCGSAAEDVRSQHCAPSASPVEHCKSANVDQHEPRD